MSWGASKGLGILPEHYPHPVPAIGTLSPPIKISQPPPVNFSKEFPTVFDGVVRNMDGAEFHILLTKHAKPF